LVEQIFSGSFDCALPPPFFGLAEDDRRIELARTQASFRGKGMHRSFGCRLRMTEGEGMAEGNNNASEKVTASQDDRSGILSAEIEQPGKWFSSPW
jgi:hypothetical protein